MPDHAAPNVRSDEFVRSSNGRDVNSRLRLLRLFAGIALPPFALERLAATRLRLATPNDGLGWLSPEQWHITLRFFGEVEPEQAEAIKSALSKLGSAPVPVGCDHLGLFPTKGILFAAIELSPALSALQAQVTRLTAEQFALPTSHTFHPHITLARSKGPLGMRSLQRLATPALPSVGAALCWKAQELLLFESRLSRQGAAYDVVDRYEFQADLSQE